MNELQLLAQAIDKATQKGCYNLDECALLIDALKKLQASLPETKAEESKTDGESK